MTAATKVYLQIVGTEMVRVFRAVWHGEYLWLNESHVMSLSTRGDKVAYQLKLTGYPIHLKALIHSTGLGSEDVIRSTGLSDN